MTILGIDIGGSALKGAIVDTEKGQLITERFKVATPKGANPDKTALVFNQIIEHFTWEGKVGVGFPAVIRNGVCETAANISDKWIGLDLNKLFSEVSHCQVWTLNDADAAGIAEMNFGVGKKLTHGVALILTLGTGIGSAFFVDGHLFPNTEFGHMQVRGKDAEKRASAAARKDKKLSWKAWSRRLQEVLDEIEFLTSPDLIIVGGGISRDADKFLPLLKTRAKIVQAQYQNQAGIIGAAIYANQGSYERMSTN
jgi:polyphosphate glucokinase